MVWQWMRASFLYVVDMIFDPKEGVATIFSLLNFAVERSRYIETLEVSKEQLKAGASQHQESIEISVEQHHESIEVAREQQQDSWQQHKESLDLTCDQHRQALDMASRQHNAQMSQSKKETRRENLRDMLSATLDYTQVTVVSSTLLFGLVVAILVEAFPLAENKREVYVDAYVFFVPWAMCWLFQSITIAVLYQCGRTDALRSMMRELHRYDVESEKAVAQWEHYKTQAQRFVKAGSLMALICLAAVFFGRLQMRRGVNYGEGLAEIHMRIGIFMPPFFAAAFSLLPNVNNCGNVRTIRAAVHWCNVFMFLASLASLLFTGLWLHRAPPPILVNQPELDVTFLRGQELLIDRWPMFFNPTGIVAFGDTLLLSANFRMAKFQLQSTATPAAFLDKEVTLPGLEIGDITLAGNVTTRDCTTAIVALAGRSELLSLELRANSSGVNITWADRPNCSIGGAILGLEAKLSAEVPQALTYWAKEDLFFISMVGQGVVAVKVHQGAASHGSRTEAVFVAADDFDAGTTVMGLHVDETSEILYVLLGRRGLHGEIHALDLRDSPGRHFADAYKCFASPTPTHQMGWKRIAASYGEVFQLGTRIGRSTTPYYSL